MVTDLNFDLIPVILFSLLLVISDVIFKGLKVFADRKHPTCCGQQFSSRTPPPKKNIILLAANLRHTSVRQLRPYVLFSLPPPHSHIA